MITFYRDIDGDPIPFTTHEFKTNGDREVKIQFGQHSAANEIDGVGKIYWTKWNMEIVWEGQMKDNVLDGFARTM